MVQLGHCPGCLAVRDRSDSPAVPMDLYAPRPETSESAGGEMASGSRVLDGDE